MAVKFSPVPEVMPRSPGSEGFISVPNATPEAFGAGVGRAMEGFGQALQQFDQTVFNERMRRVALSNDLMVTDAVTALSSNLITARSEFEQRRGRSAQDGLSDFNAAVDAQIASTIESVPGMENRVRLNAAADSLALSTRQAAVNHANSQMDVWNEQSTKGITDTMRAQAVLNSDQPLIFEGMIAQGEAAIRAYDQDYGIDPEMTNAKVLAWKGDVYSDIINARIAQGDIVGARALFDANQLNMNAQSQVEILKALRVPERQARVDQIKDDSARWVAGAQGIQNLIAQNAMNPRDVQTWVARGQALVRADRFNFVDGRPVPKSEEEIEAAVTKWTGETLEYSIRSLVSQGHIDDAQGMFSSVRGQMDAESIKNVETLLKEPAQQARVNAMTGASWNGYPVQPAMASPAQMGALQSVNPSLQGTVLRAAELAAADGVELQIALNPNAPPNGAGVNLVPIRNGQPDPSWEEGQDLVDTYMQQAAQELGVAVEWGGDWTTAPDRTRFQLTTPPPGQALKSPLAGIDLNNTVQVPISGASQGSRSFGGPRGNDLHTGVDIPARVGQPVLAISDGVVVRADSTDTGGYGTVVDIRYADGTVHRAAHLSGVGRGVAVGSRVRAGQPIGFAGSSGNATDNFVHVHYEVIKGDHYQEHAGRPPGRAASKEELEAGRVDPRQYFGGGGTTAPSPYKPLIASAAQLYNVPEDRIASIIFVESSFNPNARGSSGEIGLGQFMPDTAAQLGIDPSNPEQSIDAVGKYYRQLLDMFGGNETHALMAYNWGMGNVQNWMDSGMDMATVPQSVKEYVQKVMGGPGVAGLGNRGVNTSGQMTPVPSGGGDLFNALMTGVPPVAGPATAPGDPFQAITRSEGVAPVTLSRPSLEERIERAQAYAISHGFSQEDFLEAVTKIRAEESLIDATTKSEQDSLRRTAGTLSEAALAGKPLAEPFPEEAIRYFFPRDEANALVDTYRVNTAAGMLVQGARWSSQGEITSILSQVRDPNSPLVQGVMAGFGLQGEFSPGVPAYDIYEGVVTAVEGLAKERTTQLLEDPAAYVAEHPSVQAAREAVRAEPTMENWQTFAAVALSVQSHLGVPPEDQHVLTKAEAMQQAQLVQQDPATFLNTQREFQGEFFNNYMQDISQLGDLPVAYQFVGLIPDPKYQDLLGRALRDQMADGEKKNRLAELIDRGVDGTARPSHNIEIGMPTELEDYISALRAQGILPEQITAMLDTANLLAMADVWYNNTDDGTALTNAATALKGQFDFIQNGGEATALIPMEQSDAIRARMDRTLDRIFPSPELLPGDDFGDAPPNPLAVLVPNSAVLNSLGMATTEDWFRELRANPTWITNPTNTGLNLVDPTTMAVVFNLQGQPFTVPFDPDPVFDAKLPPRPTVQSLAAETQFREGEESRRLAEEAAASRDAPPPLPPVSPVIPPGDWNADHRSTHPVREFTAPPAEAPPQFLEGAELERAAREAGAVRSTRTIAADDPRLAEAPPTVNSNIWHELTEEQKRAAWDRYLQTHPNVPAEPPAR